MSETKSPSIQDDRTQHFLHKLISAHASIQLAPERYKAELLAGLSLSFSIIIFGGLLVTIQAIGFNILINMGIFFELISIITYILSRSPFYTRAPLIFISGFALLAYTASIFGDYPSLFLILTFSILFLLANLFDFKQLIWTIIINIVAAFVLSAFMRLEGQELLNLQAGIVSIGVFVILFAWHRENLETLRLDEATLAQRIAEESNIELKEAQKEATNRLEEIRLAAKIGQTISEERALDVMLAKAVELIRTQFSLYYVQIYLTDAKQSSLILEIGTGEVGRKLLNRAHRLPLNSGSINGRAAFEKHAIVVSDTRSSASFTKNPLLPETRSEMAIPLIVQNKIIGVLDIQSDEVNFLHQAILPAFEALAGQLAVAIENTRLLAETEEARTETEAQAKKLSRRNWEEYLDAIHKPEEVGFVFEKNQLSPLTQEDSSQENTLLVPINIAGETLGSLAVNSTDNDTLEKNRVTNLLNVVAKQVAQQVENLRLFEISERYRIEAEEASRRLTREAWQAYQKEKKLAFLYQDAQVQPLPETDFFDKKNNYALKINNTTIGEVNIAETETFSEEDADLVASITEQLSTHLENLRLSEETNQALAETESLYNASREITAAPDVDEVANALVKYIDHSQLDRVVVAYIDKNVKDTIQAEVRAIWDRAGKLKAGNIFTSTQMPVLENLGVNDILIVDNFETTEEVDPASKAVFAYLEVKSAAIIPISVGNTLFGWILLETTTTPRQFSAVDMNPFAALAGQAGIVLESQHLLKQSQNRAEREQALSKITSAIRSSTDPRTILRTTVRELGTVLGRHAMIQMTTKTEVEDK